MLLDHDGRAAVDALNDSRPYDDLTDLELSPAYYRGLAYLQAGETKAALAEFRLSFRFMSVLQNLKWVAPFKSSEITPTRRGPLMNSMKSGRMRTKTFPRCKDFVCTKNRAGSDSLCET